MYTVYKHTTPSGKVYIGITSRKAEERWNNGYNYIQNKHFYSAIKKYGWDKIKHDILFENLSKDEAYKKEIELIAFYKSNQRDFGYNKSIGGESSVKGAHWSLSKESVEKRAKQLRGRKFTEEHKKKLSESHKGQVCHMKGKTMPLETRKKISESLKKWNSENISPSKGRKYKKSEYAILRTSQGHYKKIICLETKEIFDSIKTASEKTKIDSSSLSKVCKGKRETAGGYHWEYKYDL